MLKEFRGLLMFFLPSFILRRIQSLLKIRMSKGARIGFSLVISNRIVLSKNSKIGHFNIIKVESLCLGNSAYIQSFNRVSGAIAVWLSNYAGIGNFNTILRASLSVKNTLSSLYLGNLSKITSRHYVDCLSKIEIRSYSTIAGIGSQLWTHGYYHYPGVHKRVRIDGDIAIGRYCYIGSSTIFNPGIRICDSVNIGSNSCISKSIDKPGFYTSQPLRQIEQSGNFESRLTKGDADSSCEKYFIKRI